MKKALLTIAFVFAVYIAGYRLIVNYQPIMSGGTTHGEILNVYNSHHGEKVFFLRVKVKESIKPVIVPVPDTLDVKKGSYIALVEKTPKYIGNVFYRHE